MNLPLTPEKLQRQAKRMDRLHHFVADRPLGHASRTGPDGYPERPMQISFTYADAATIARMAARLIATESRSDIELAATPEAQEIIALATRLLVRPHGTQADPADPQP